MLLDSNNMGNKGLGTVGQWAPGIVLFPHSLILFKPCLGLNCLRNKVWEKSRGKDFCSTWVHTSSFSVPLLQDVLGFQQKGQKVTLYLVYSRPGAHSLLDPSNV